jgi:glutathione synthase/RimK-type ligase-like ATP-grasp enzyme
MKLAIHHRKGSYSEGWIDYCTKKGIPCKIVDAYHSDIIQNLQECDAFMWHFHHDNPKDCLFAKQLLYSLEQAGKVVYPNWRSSWSFDDKLGQKYLLEALKLPIIPSFAFYSKNEAKNWALQYTFPAVFKLRGGAGSYNVRRVENKDEALKLIKKAFNGGFRQYDPYVGIIEKIRKIKKGEASAKDVAKEVAHILLPYQVEKSKGREKGYVYFQEYIPHCEYDMRVQFIGKRCYAMKRYVRKNDFRASGGGNIDYDGSKLPSRLIELSFSIAKILNMQTLALDLIPVGDSYKLAEISFAFAIDMGECDFGYYDESLQWHEGKFNPYGWMVDEVLNIN